jgi:hypothetical protein
MCTSSSLQLAQFMFWIAASAGEDAALVAAANSMQDSFGEDGDPESWQPVSPIHGHPASGGLVDAVVLRRSCEEWSARIGDIGHPPRFEPATPQPQGRYVLHVRWQVARVRATVRSQE